MAGDGATDVAELLDGLARQLGGSDNDDAAPDQDQRRGRERTRGWRGGGGFESLAPAGGYGRPVAATLAVAAQLLGASPQRVREAAQTVEPYVHHDGSPRWSLMLLERALGQRPRQGPGSGHASTWRAEYRATYRAAQRGAAGGRPRPRAPDPSESPGA
jgi:hypothetical protein